MPFWTRPEDDPLRNEGFPRDYAPESEGLSQVLPNLLKILGPRASRLPKRGIFSSLGQATQEALGGEENLPGSLLGDIFKREAERKASESY